MPLGLEVCSLRFANEAEAELQKRPSANPAGAWNSGLESCRDGQRVAELGTSWVTRRRTTSAGVRVRLRG